MQRVTITTAGISLLNNWKGKNEGQAPSLSKLCAYLDEFPDGSAETNSLNKLTLDPRYDHLYIIGSGTDDGKLCLDAIVQHYQSQGFHYVLSESIPGLSKNYADMQRRGLINLLHSLSRIIESHPGVPTIINATGGFKAQTSFATLFGIFLGIEVVYLHEDFGNLLRFPPMPVACDYRLVSEYKEKFNEILEAGSKGEAQRIIKTLPASLQGFFHKDDGCCTYSPVGKMFIASMGTKSGRKTYKVRTYKNHTSLWGDGINDIEEISDPVVRSLFYRIFDCSDAVTEIYLDEMVNRRDAQVFFEYVETVNHARYLVHTPKDGQYIKVEVLPGNEHQVLKRIGKRIYP